MRRVIPLLAVLAAVSLAGCLNVSDPDRHLAPAPTTATATTTAAGTTTPDPTPAPERGGTIPPAAHRAQQQLAREAGSKTPQAALSRYATLWCNWTAATVVARQRQLAAMSLGQARAQALQAAASLAADKTLAASHVATSGQVIAITLRLNATNATVGWVVVTQEQTTGAGAYHGLPATLHITYAQVAGTRAGFVVSAWSPQT